MLRRLDGHRKGQVVRALYDAGLLSGRHRIDLIGADLRRLDMNHVVLPSGRLDLSGSDLRGADFRDVDGSFKLSGADLRGAHFDRAILGNLDLSLACLSNTHFRDSKLQFTMNLSDAMGHDIDFTHATLGFITGDPIGLTHVTRDNLVVFDVSSETGMLTPAQQQASERRSRQRLEAMRRKLETNPLRLTRRDLDDMCDSIRGGRAE